MEELIEFVAKSLVDEPDAVSAHMYNRGDQTIVELEVAQNDLGKVIGRQGRTAAALRTLASTAGEREGKTVTLEIRESR